jgi:hypothetical protein
MEKISWREWFWITAVVASLACGAAGLIEFATADPASKTVNYAGTYLLGGVVGFWMLVLFCGFLWTTDRALKVATKRIPSVQEIELQLRREGFDPSLQDVLAVEAHLKSNRNEGIVLAGALVLGAVALGRQASGKSIL